jgi:cobalt-zinc-cadmium efflux system membrane fusion protein
VNVKKIALFITLVFFTSFAVFKISHELKKEEAPPPKKAALKEANVIHYEKNAPQLAYLKTAIVEVGQVPTTEALQGAIVYNDDLTSKITTPIAGRVTKIYAQIGDKVKMGQPLVMIDSPEFGQANADLMKSESDLTLKNQAFERAKTLYEGEVIAKKEFEAAAADLKQAEAEHQRALNRLKNYGVSKNNNFMLSTKVNGIVTERQVNPGSEVSPNSTSLFVVTDPKHLWVNIEVPEKDLDKIHLKQHLKIETSAYPNESFQAAVTTISKVLNPDTRRVMVRCTLENLDEKLKPEMYAYATPIDDELIMPHVVNDAVITEGVKSFVFVERSPGEIEKRLVKVSYQGHKEAYISEGLHEGERVIVTSTLLLNSEFTEN